eukprot:1161301-Pelagomonas_calceolata.AAC.5
MTAAGKASPRQCPSSDSQVMTDWQAMHNCCAGHAVLHALLPPPPGDPQVMISKPCSANRVHGQKEGHAVLVIVHDSAMQC